MLELVAFAPFHASAVSIRSSAGTTLRVLLGATFVTATDAALLATDPEALDDEDLLWLTRTSDAGSEPRLTALASPWRARLSRGEVEVTKDAPVPIDDVDWETAAIEIGDQWLPSPTLRPFVFVVVSGERRNAKPQLCRVDFARWRDRLRTVWRYEITLPPSDTLDEIHAGIGEDDSVAPRSRDRTQWREIKRFPVEERHPLEDTVSALEVPVVGALPFVELPRQETVELEPLAPPRAKPMTDHTAPASVQDPASRRTIGELLADGRTRPALFTAELDARPPVVEGVQRLKRVDVLWYEESAARRARKQPRLRPHFPKVRWAGSGSEETEERHRRDLANMLREATPTSLVSLAAGELDESDEDGSTLYVVAGDLQPEFDEVAILSATVAGTFAMRSEHPSVERAAAAGERALADAPLADAPFLASSATAEILAAVKAIGKAEAVDELARGVERALVRKRSFANRELEGSVFVRAALSLGGARETRCVVYLRASAAEKLPLLLSMQTRSLVHVLPPQEEGDSANCLIIDVLARET